MKKNPRNRIEKLQIYKMGNLKLNPEAEQYSYRCCFLRFRYQVPEDSENKLYFDVENQSRIGFIKASLKTSQCSKDELDTLYEMVEQHPQQFCVGGDKLERSDITSHRIELVENDVTVNERNARLPEKSEIRMTEEMEILKQQGVISESMSR